MKLRFRFGFRLGTNPLEYLGADILGDGGALLVGATVLLVFLQHRYVINQATTNTMDKILMFAVR